MEKLNKKHLDNFIESLIRMGCKEFNGIRILKADARVGNKVGLGKIGEGGTIRTLTDFMSYEEMNQFLRGYMFRADEKFIK